MKTSPITVVFSPKRGGGEKEIECGVTTTVVKT